MPASWVVPSRQRRLSGQGDREYLVLFLNGGNRRLCAVFEIDGD
jgi:hypothetical protein